MMTSGHDRRVHFVADKPGPWLVRATRVVAVDGKAAEWEGRFTTMTFNVAATADSDKGR